MSQNIRIIPTLVRMAALLLALLPVMPLSAAPTVEFLEPAGAARGAETTVQVTGTFAVWPPKVWVDRPGVEWTPAEKANQFQVRVAADAAPGVYWLRFYDDTGATTPRPFVVGLLPEALEAEPNNSPSKAQGVQQPVTLHGRLAEKADVDTFLVQAEAGQTLVAAVEANQTYASPMDGILQICNERGFVLAQNNDARGLDPLLAYPVTKSGPYLIRVFAFPATPNSSIALSGGATYVYRLTITAQGYLDYALPMAVPRGSTSTALPAGWNIADQTTPLTSVLRDEAVAVLFRPDLAGTLEVPVAPENCTFVTPSLTKMPGPPAALPFLATGCLAQPGEEHLFALSATKKQRVHLEVTAQGLDSDLDPQLRFASADDKINKSFDDSGRDENDVDVVEGIPADGEYRVTVSSAHGHGGPRQVYRLLVELAGPTFSLAPAAGELTIEPGNSTEVTLNITRSKDMAADIGLTALELPAGITAEAVSSVAKEPSGKSVKLKLTATAEAVSGPFSIVGEAAGETPLQQTARISVPGSRTGLKQLWITVKRPLPAAAPAPAAEPAKENP